MVFLRWLLEALIGALLKYFVPLIKGSIDTAKGRDQIKEQADAEAKRNADELKRADTEEERKRATEDMARNSL